MKKIILIVLAVLVLGCNSREDGVYVVIKRNSIGIEKDKMQYDAIVEKWLEVSCNQ